MNQDNVLNSLPLPPFYVGQRVVAIKTALKSGTYKEGDKKIVKGVIWHCKEWFIDVGIPVSTGKGTLCPHCELSMNKDFIWYCYASHFAPIEENFASISYSRVMEEEGKLVSSN